MPNVIRSTLQSSSGHTIVDDNGNEYAKRRNLVIGNGWVEDDPTNNATVLHSTNFEGTRAEWNSLSLVEKAKYRTCDITDDYSVYPLDDVPTSESDNAVKSGGVYSALANKSNKADVVLYFTSVACSATTGTFSTVSDSAISADHVVVECTFSKPNAITSDVTWTTASGTLTLSGTCSDATCTVDIVLVRKGN